MERDHADELGDKQRELEALARRVAELEAEKQRRSRDEKSKKKEKGEKDKGKGKEKDGQGRPRRLLGRVIGSLLGAVGVIALFGIFSAPLCQRCHGRSFRLALALANACPEVREKLGAPISWGFGCNGGKTSCSENRNVAAWGLDVSGSKGSAKMRYRYSRDGHVERFDAYLYLDGKRIDLRRCVIAAGRGDLLKPPAR